MILIDLFVLFYTMYSVGLINQALILVEDTINQIPGI
jgi:hypothetical protein